MLFYRILAALAAPAVAAILVARLVRGRESMRDLAERLGGAPAEPSAIWVHGASNGELTSARKLIGALAEAYPDRPMVVTANTTTGRALAASWTIPHTTARLAPLDLRWTTARFLRRWRPAALVVLESEIWPNRFDLCRRTGVPVAVVAARMSARSARRWGRFPRLVARLLSAVAYLSPQDAASGERVLGLGLPADRLGPVSPLKAGVLLDPPPDPELRRLRRVFDHTDTWLAASTHPGEETLVLDALAAARRDRPGLKLILAPRHPRRSGEIEAAARAAGHAVAVRSRGEAPDAGTDVYLADTLGEMALWYTLAGTCFVGGSLVEAGGHTPYEPAAFGSAILHGPHVANFADAYARLHDAGAAVRVDGAVALADALCSLTPQDRETMSRRARDALAGTTGEDVTRAALDAVSRLVSSSERRP